MNCFEMNRVSIKGAIVSFPIKKMNLINVKLILKISTTEGLDHHQHVTTSYSCRNCR